MKIDELFVMVSRHFPGLWPAVEIAVSTFATLLLKDNSNPVALIFVGPPASSKTTVANLFATHDGCYFSDQFTPASFVSHSASTSGKKLEKVDLLPKIRHKLLVTPELGPFFRGREEDLTQRFAVITRVLDGQGLQTDSGVHGRRGYRGDYLFSWIGCTTPLDKKVWRVMAGLGSRLFFYQMNTSDVSVDELLHSTNGLPYGEKVTICQEHMKGFLEELLETNGGVRGCTWASEDDPKEVRERIAGFAKILVAMRSQAQTGEIDELDGIVIEQPHRAFAVLNNLARGRALVYGRTRLSIEDLPMVARVTLSSMPGWCARMFKALVTGGAPLTVAECQKVLGVSSPETVRNRMKRLARTGIMVYREEGPGKAATLEFRPDYGWCVSDEVREWLESF